MTLAEAIKDLYPTANPAFDYMVADFLDGEGQKLVQWNEQKLGPRPEPAVLAAKMAEG